MGKIKFYLNKSKGTEKSRPVFINYNFNGERLRYFTGVSVSETHFYPDAKNPIRFDSDALVKNQKLILQKNTIGAIEIQYLAMGITLTEEIFRKELDAKFKSRPVEDAGEGKVTLTKYIDYYIENLKIRTNIRTGAKLSKAMPRKYGSVRNVFKEFCTYKNMVYDFQDLDRTFCIEFVAFMVDVKNFSTNYYGRIVRFFKTILKAAEEDDYPVNPKYKHLVSVSESVDNISFDETELEKIGKLDLSENKRLEPIRDMFLIGCYTGMRFNDFINLLPTDVDMEKQEIKVFASKSRWRVIIPMHPVVKKVIEKYNFELPRPRSNQKFNKYIKEIVELAKIDQLFTKYITKGGVLTSIVKPKYQFASSHACRRSFATNSVRRNISTHLIMAITGHKTESEFWKYVNMDAEEKAKHFREAAGW